MTKKNQRKKSPSPKRSRRVGFLTGYNPSENYLLSPGRAKGIPGILEGTSERGNPVLIRVWPRGTKVDDRDLVDIWKNELRVLHRLGGCAGAEEYIGRLIDAGQDKTGFYIVIDAGQKRPVATFLDSVRSSTGWLRTTSSSQRRRQLWENLRRVALGLEILHSQGLIHCNLDAWSIITSGGIDLDFQLTGFEWSMRLLGAGGHMPRANEDAAVSFLDDWAAFARVSAKLLNLNEGRVLDIKISSHAVSDHTSAEEISFLRDLLFPGPFSQIDGDFVVRRIDRIISAVSAAAAADDAQYYVILRLGQENGLSRAVREASDQSIEIDDLERQQEFIRGDLGAEPRLLISQSAEEPIYYLRGSELIYRLRQYRISNDTLPSWEFVVCEAAWLAKGWSGRVDKSQPMSHSAINFMSFAEARERVPRLRRKALSWKRLIDELGTAIPSEANKEERVRRSFSLLHAMDLLMATVEVFPVSIKFIGATGDDQEPKMHLQISDEPGRAEAGEALGLKSPSKRLQELLDRDEVSDEEGWLFTEAKALGNRTANDIELQYDATESLHGETTFSFRITSTVPPIPPTNGLLVPGEYRGRIAQFGRRARALRGLREHSELLRMLADPRSRLVNTHDKLDEDPSLDRLDDAKRVALKELIAILPLYMLQGPPGVGKTFLVRELVRRKFVDEPTARLLLTAQSHHSVDHLMFQLLKDWKADTDNQVLAVRCVGSRKKATATGIDLSSQTRALTEKLAMSELNANSSEHLQQSLKRVLSVMTSTNGTGSKVEAGSLEGLVMRAANVVFATTNSADLEMLVDERGQFDWTIVEEAGRATGVELLLPLLLSHRRLMIGDHKQLPPFGSERAAKLLEDPGKLKRALRIGLPLIERSLKNVVSDDLAEMIDDDDNDEEFADLCSHANRTLFLFQELIEDEINRQKKPGARASNIAHTLTIQHRMHPVIAAVVSRCFYENALITGEKAKSTFSAGTCPISTADGTRLPNAPLVVVDIPYQQDVIRGGFSESLPRYTNAEEVRIVKEIVQLLRPATTQERPSLAILSPYARQVSKIRTELKESDECLEALSKFDAVTRDGEWSSTVDAFQGNEADAIIVSLTRNNQHSIVRKALGFVSDPRRMNVALSRARWRLYVVTSLEFLRTVASPLGLKEYPEAKFLREMIETFEQGFKDGTVTRVTPDQIGASR